jgi:hypothetical protein
LKRFFFTRTSKLVGGRSVPDNSQPIRLWNQGEDHLPILKSGRPATAQAPIIATAKDVDALAMLIAARRANSDVWQPAILAL